LREHGIEILHVNDTYALRAAAKAVEESKIPLVLSFHNNLNIPYSSYGVRFPLSSWLDSREKGVLEAARRCSFVMATSNYVAQRLIGAGLPPALVKPIYVGGAIRPAGSLPRGSLPGQSNHHDIRVLCVGKMQYHKGFQNIVIAAKKLIMDGILAEVIFVGDGPYHGKLRNLTRKLGVTDRVKLVGHVDQQELERLYDWSDTVVVPTITPEPFGRVAVEAMSTGRPVIGTNTGGLTEIIDDGETGFLVPPGDSSAIVEKLLIFRNQPHLLAEMGGRALKRCKAVFDQTTIASQVLDVYRSIAPNA
jgi:glycosyltransferase involved in cell wall biosynthesis